MKNFNVGDYVFYGTILTLFVVIATSLTVSAKYAPSPSQIQAQMNKFGCKPTNQFVGKSGDRLYLCADGVMYKYEGFRQLAWEENKK